MKRIGILGLGNMGESIVRALLGAGNDPADILFFEIKPERMRRATGAYGIGAAAGPADLAAQCRYVILAVKPQDAKSAIAALARSVDDSRIIISIMAGVAISSIISMLGKTAKIVRVMPNIGAAVGEGALGLAANALLTPDELGSVAALLAPLGRIVEVNEEQMDAVTALSGSGPAFFLSFLEAMIDGGVKMGLPRDKAHDLAVQTVKGTVALLEKEHGHPAVLKERVTSPGGTTIAGLIVLEEKGFKGILMRALEAAKERAGELSR
jgi:pyrroline-5-carboxylate reductase